MNAQLLFVLLYTIGLTALGVWMGRLVKLPADFFVAGRSLPAALLAATVLAANIGAGTTVGAAGLAYRDGLSAWWWNGAAGIGCLVLAFTVGPRMWREPAPGGRRSARASTVPSADTLATRSLPNAATHARALRCRSRNVQRGNSTAAIRAQAATTMAA